MLLKLRIQNFILIDSLELDLKPGMTTMTGETGAGKSILLGALGAALGARMASKGILKDPDQKAVVELECAIPPSLEPVFAQEDVDFDTRSVFRRELLPGGRSRSFINDTPVKSSLLAFFSGQFIDINSQSDSGLLTDASKQLELIDAFGVADDVRQAYSEVYEKYTALRRERRLLEQSGDGSDLDYLEFLSKELAQYKVKSGEEEALDETIAEHRSLRDALQTYEELQGRIAGEGGALDALFEMEAALNRLARQDAKAESWLQQALSAIDAVQEIERAVSAKLASAELEVDVDALEERRSVLTNLLRKHRVATTQELVAKQEEIDAQIQAISQRSERLQALEKEMNATHKLLMDCGEKLQAERVKCGAIIEGELALYLERVDLPKAKLQLQWETTDPTVLGTAVPIFAFSANPGQLLQPLAKVASGGEQSRVKLALKAVLGRHAALSTQIFDEIDTGISGSTAEKVGMLMAELAREQQIIAITHLPQVAARGTTHWKVEKIQGEADTASTVRALNAAERIEELARMLSGKEVTAAAKKQAKALLAASE